MPNILHSCAVKPPSRLAELHSGLLASSRLSNATSITVAAAVFHRILRKTNALYQHQTVYLDSH